jgi:CelD/BcsL family acetyltransferase involved in cellulose biosynthesis
MVKSRMASSDYAIEAITTQEGFAGLEQDWNRLSQASELPNVFTTFDWFRAWNERFVRETQRSQRSLNVLVLRKGGAVAGISPLVRIVSPRAGFAVRRLEFVGREWDYNDLVVGDSSAGQIEAVMQFLAGKSEQWDVIDLRELREAGNAIPQLECALSRAMMPYRIGPEEERCPVMLINGPWSEMVKKRSPSTRRTFRKQQARLKQLSAEGLRIRILENPGPEPGLLERLVALEAQKQVCGQLSPPFVGKYQEVFRSLFDTLGPRGWIYVALMELGEHLLAWQLWFRCGRELWGYLTAYDNTFAHLSPGTMLVPAIIDYGFERGFRKCDFLRGEEAYKMRWTTDFHQNYRVRIWNRRWISQVRKFAYFDLRPALHQWLP